MPLNALQRETLFDIVTGAIDSILDSPIEYKIKMECLQNITTGLPTLDQVIKILHDNPNLVRGLAEQTNIPAKVRGCWAEFLKHLSQNHPMPEALLKELREINNYNPFYIAAMKMFEDYVGGVPALAPIKIELIRLREIYLEMTPLNTYSYGEQYFEFSFRIGNIPLNLDHYGPTPIKEEVQSDVMRIISDRVAQAEKYQKELEIKEKNRQDMEKAALNAQLREGDLSLAINLFLKDSDEKERSEQIKQGVVSSYTSYESMSSSSHLPDIASILVAQLAQQDPSLLTASGPLRKSSKETIFLQLQINLNNRITQDILSTQTAMSERNTQLKNSPAYLDLRKAEFCYVLLQAQLEVVESCKVGTSRDEINKQYAAKIEATYQMYMDDMCTKWMAERHGRTLNATQLLALTEKFKQDINTIMKNDWKKLKEFRIDPSNIPALRRTVETAIQKKEMEIQTLKDAWDKQIFPLVDLASKCSDLRKIRQLVQTGNFEVFNTVLTELFRLSTDRGAADYEGYTFLHYACLLGDMALVREFLQAVSVSPTTAHTRDGYSPLHLVCRQPWPTTRELLKLLLDTLLIEANKQKGVKIGIRDILETKNKKGRTPLHVAAIDGNVVVAQWLKETLPNDLINLLNLVDREGSTPLHYAAHYGHEEMVDYLLSQGANYKIANRNNSSALLLAVLNGQVKVAQVFSHHGLCLNKEERQLCSTNKRNVLNILNCLTVPVVDSFQVMTALKPILGELARENKNRGEVTSPLSPSSSPTSPVVQFSPAKTAARSATGIGEFKEEKEGKEIAEEAGQINNDTPASSTTASSSSSSRSFSSNQGGDRGVAPNTSSPKNP
jgi:ankyrin repeat protein